MLSGLSKLHRYIFARPAFVGLNRILFRLSLRGLGILNYENFRVSGERHVLRKVLPKVICRNAPVLLDVGANIGEYSAELARCFPEARIYAFEPHPRTFAFLVENLRATRVKPINLALGDATGHATLFDLADSADGSSHASLHEEVISALESQPPIRTDVQVDTLDAFAIREGIVHIDFLKIDTEGHEAAVLRGAARLLAQRRISCVQFEFSNLNMASRTYLADIRVLLPAHELFRLLPNALLPLSDSPLESELYAFQNILALPKRNAGGASPAATREGTDANARP